MADDSKGSFWGTLPGVLTAAAGFIAALTALIAGLSQAGLIGKGARSSGADETSVSAIKEASLSGVAKADSAPQAETGAKADAPKRDVAQRADEEATRGAHKTEPAARAESENKRVTKLSQPTREPVPQGMDYILSMTLVGDPRTYYITRENEVFGSTGGGGTKLVGRRIHRGGGYAWTITVDGKSYVTDGRTHVFTLEGGTATEVGRTLKLEP